jgi:alanyl-tRNA synthetase
MAFDPIVLPSDTKPTVKLFHADPYLRGAQAEVVHVEGPYVVLDGSLFYGESGGQEWDEGLIGGLSVTDVQHQGGAPLIEPPIQAGTTLVHRLAEAAPFTVGQRVDMTIDWSRRYANMRQHSACHFMYAALQTLWGGAPWALPSRGCHIKPDGARMDFGADLTDEAVAAAEAYANALIAEGRPIEMRAISDDVFEWRYGDLPSIPCGGTHCQSASELQPIRLKRKRKGVGITRVSTSFQ